MDPTTNSSTTSTSPVTRVSTSPVRFLSWKLNDSRCRWEYMATRMLYPSDRPPRAMQTSVKESAALLIAAMPMMATVSRISVSARSDVSSAGSQPSSRRLGRAPERKSMRYAIGYGSMTEVPASKMSSKMPTTYTLRRPANRRNNRTVRRKSLTFFGGRVSAGNVLVLMVLVLMTTPGSRGPDTGDLP